MKQLNQTGVQWVSRVSESLTQARAVLQEGSQTWQHAENGTIYWFCRKMELPQGSERWVVPSFDASSTGHSAASGE